MNPEGTPEGLLRLAGEQAAAHDYAAALATYRSHLAVESVVWRRYTGLIGAARTCIASGDSDRGLTYLWQALRVDSCRAEAFIEIGNYFYELGEWNHAVPYLAAATTRQRPVDGDYDEADYTWRAWDLLSVCYFNLGQHRLSLDAGVRALAANPERERVVSNIQLAVNAMADNGPQPPTRIVRVVLPKKGGDAAT